MSVLGTVLVLLGLVLLIIAAAGLFLLPDALARQHAATKSGTLALGLILVGAALAAEQGGWGWRIVAILALLLVTLPVASHMLARAAARHAYEARELQQVPLVEGSASPAPQGAQRPAGTSGASPTGPASPDRR